MGAFNVVTTPRRCPKCERLVQVRIQFKFGDTWQYEYQVGDRLRWGGNDIGKPGYRKVVIDGIAEGCPTCGFDEEWNFYIFLENDIIQTVEPASNRYDFCRVGLTYIVLEK